MQVLPLVYKYTRSDIKSYTKFFKKLMLSSKKWQLIVINALVTFMYYCILASVTCDSSTMPHCTITRGNTVCNTTHIPAIIKSLPSFITTQLITRDTAYDGSLKKSDLPN